MVAVNLCRLCLVAIFVVIAVYSRTMSRTTMKGYNETIIKGYSKMTMKGYRELISTPPSSCDLFSGKWVYDNSTNPLYSWKQCSFWNDWYTCEKHGRKDVTYQNWKWQPEQCDLPRFNAEAFLERLRGKRMVYVGDSMSTNQWASMVCMVESVIPSALKSMHSNGSLMIFKAIEFNATIERYWAPFLVESNADNPVYHRVPHRIVRVGAIEKHAIHWSDADILVFDSYLWWKDPELELLWGPFVRPNVGIYKDLGMLGKFEVGLKTWSNWLENHINLTKTQLFFNSITPVHARAGEWGKNKEGNCYNETEPILQEHYWGQWTSTEFMKALESTVDELKHKGVDVKILNITQLSEYRKEAHTSVYKKIWDTSTPVKISDPVSYSDCHHWCLPGVPDTWNELLYAYILPK
ncbi:hypothetical protein C5167_027799 [Papaver somniferum]|uniref:protein trichome birefringence-like 34 isoform X1 n=1 Tax=Papaver somniferum TaxID=3469 RepID=UPI000E70214F|nr:protein trichome birefringence-like 34 isoform X1 [Papaver somniferum]RZC91743.1 hypothetical protein C5167_027799 [Papaver somniferum]